MAPRKYFVPMLMDWYASLSLLEKLLYPLIGLGIYLLSALLLVGLYWLKTDMGYNMITGGGWHAFSHCLAREVKINPTLP